MSTSHRGGGRTALRVPLLGHPGRVAETREIVVAHTPFILVYIVDADDLIVLRVLHGRQQWPPAP